jgi:uncharacterized Zn finger protein (UPF0148 family)
MAKRSCPYCKKRVSDGDSCCPACGKRLLYYKFASDTIAKPASTKPKVAAAKVVEPRMTPRSAKRQSARPLRRLLPLLIIGGIAAIGAISAHFASHDRVIPETKSSPGYVIVRDLQKRGEIDTFAAIEPKQGWDSEYSLNDGEAHLYFRGTSEAHFEISSSAAAGLKDAIDQALARAGYQ